ncbi:MAG: hypothetical protein ACRDRM_09685 [Pseudonocardiaceae bacterium]
MLRTHGDDNNLGGETHMGGGVLCQSVHMVLEIGEFAIRPGAENTFAAA